MDTNKSRVTIAEVAQRAGVSVPTVSKVINAKPGVSDATRDRVNALIRELDYEPRKSTPTHMLELVLAEMSSPWSAALVLAVEDAAYAEGFGLTVTRMREAPDDRWLEMLSARNADGVIFAAVPVDERISGRLAGLGSPYAVIDPTESPRTSAPTIGVTHWRGAYVATEHLIELGHRELGMIAGPELVLFSRARVDGFRAAAGAAGVVVPDDHIIFADLNFEAGRDAALALLSGQGRPTAIFAASDEQAFGAYEAARRLGLSIPEQLSVIGFNDVAVAQWAAPPLTTVREPIGQMARLAVAAVIGLLSGRPPAPAIELATELVVRESTAPPRR
ncbi:LacI family DNA-binding transcriptional regulator [Promicromonospora sp. Populi]|uniref:LacI family DNA-binding transcriptional regulator n=1 Tax=Promicromonospora sp. Populi TaxID=3239420 RepID=UPI0034E2A841